MDSSDDDGLPLAWESAVIEWKRHLRDVVGRSPHTVRAYVGDARALATFAWGLDIDAPRKVRPDDVRDWLADMVAAGVARSTLARRVSGVRSWFRWQADRGMVDDDPTANVRAAVRGSRLPRVPTVAEVLVLLEIPDANTTVGLRDRAILETLYAAGIRVSELAALDLDDVDLERGRVRVLGKGNKQRLAPIGPHTIDALGAWIDGGRPAMVKSSTDDALFVGARGARINTRAVRDLVTTHATAAGIRELSPHGLRHACATHMLAGGADLRTVQELLGHSALATTQRYTRVSRGHLIDVHSDLHPRA